MKTLFIGDSRHAEIWKRQNRDRPEAKDVRVYAYGAQDIRGYKPDSVHVVYGPYSRLSGWPKEGWDYLADISKTSEHFKDTC